MAKTGFWLRGAKGKLAGVRGTDDSANADVDSRKSLQCDEGDFILPFSNQIVLDKYISFS